MQEETKGNFIKEHLLLGFIILLPISLLIVVVVWLYRLINAIIDPIAGLYGTPTLIIKAIVFILLLIVVLLIGISTKTKPGKIAINSLERYVFSNLPGYNFIKKLIKPFVGDGLKENFESVALVDIYDNKALMTAFITERHDNGYITVFIPSGPNPTTGLIYHLPKQRVHIIKAKVDDVFSSVLAVGAGSAKLIKKLKIESRSEGNT